MVSSYTQRSGTRLKRCSEVFGNERTAGQTCAMHGTYAETARRYSTEDDSFSGDFPANAETTSEMHTMQGINTTELGIHLHQGRRKVTSSSKRPRLRFLHEGI